MNRIEARQRGEQAAKELGLPADVVHILHGDEGAFWSFVYASCSVRLTFRGYTAEKHEVTIGLGNTAEAHLVDSVQNGLKLAARRLGLELKPRTTCSECGAERRQ